MNRSEERGAVEAAFARALRLAAATAPTHERAPTTDAVLTARLAPVLERLHEDEANPLVDELGEVARMSRYQLIRAMKRATGFSPLAWRHNDRVLTARGMLREGRDLAETATMLGFADQARFTRVFRAHVAAPPGAYRA